MKIVTDSKEELLPLPEQRAELDLGVVPFVVSLEGKLYREDGDIQPDEV